MEVFRAEISHPKRKSLLHVTNLREYIRQYKANKETATEYLHSFISFIQSSKSPSDGRYVVRAYAAMFLTWLIYVPELQIIYDTLHPILTNFVNIVQQSHRFLSHLFHFIIQKDITTLPNNYKKQFCYII